MGGFSRFIGFIFGIIVVAAGVYFFINPELAFFTTGIVIGTAITLEGLSCLIMWISLKRNDIGSGWTFISALISLGLGIYIIINYSAQTTVSIILLYLIAIWLIVAGISKIVQAAKFKSLKDEFPYDLKSGGWIWMLIIGIIVMLAGFASIANPILLIVSLGLMLGIDLIIVGFGMIITAVTA